MVATGARGAVARRLPAWCWGALACILFLSAWVQWTTVRETRFFNAGGPDAASYVSYAYNLKAFGIYSRAHTWDGSIAGDPVPDAVSPPGYPLFLAPFLRGGPDYAFMQRVISAQAALGVLTTLFAFLLGSRAAGPRIACVVGLLTAITPHLATITTSVLTESLFTCLLVASAYAFACALQDGRWFRWAAAGLVFGACCLVRPTLQLLPVLALGLTALLPCARPYFRRASVAAACCCLLLLPWLAYKYSLPTRSDQPNLLRATLYHGSFPGLMYADDPRTFGFGYRFDPHAAEIMASDAGLVKWVGGRMQAQPLRYLQWYLVGKPIFFLSWDNSAAGAGDIFIDQVADSPFFHRPSFRLMRSLMHALHWPLVLLGVAGAVLALRRRSSFGACADIGTLRFLAWLTLAAIVFHMVGAPYPRYGIPFWPVLYVLGAATVAAATHLARGRNGPLRLETANAN